MKKIISFILLIAFVISLTCVFSVSASAAISVNILDSSSITDLAGTEWIFTRTTGNGWNGLDVRKPVSVVCELRNANNNSLVYSKSFSFCGNYRGSSYSYLYFYNNPLNGNCLATNNFAGMIYTDSYGSNSYSFTSYLITGVTHNNYLYVKFSDDSQTDPAVINFMRTYFGLVSTPTPPVTSYTLTFDPGTGTFPASVPTTDGKYIVEDVEAGTSLIDLLPPANPSFSGIGNLFFEGWYNGLGQRLGSVGVTETKAMDETFTARYTGPYTVSFDANGGNPSTIQSLERPPGGFLPSNPPAVSREGYAFDGWYNSMSIKYENLVGLPITSDETFTARWTQDSGYTISFVTNKQGYNPPSSVVGVLRVPVEWLNNGYPLPTFEAPYQDLASAGWIGWTLADGSQPPPAGSTLTGDLVLYGQWSDVSYTLSFGFVTGFEDFGDLPAPVYVDRIPSDLPPVFPNDSKYTFDGWYWNEDGSGGRVVIGSPLGADTTIYAKFVLKPAEGGDSEIDTAIPLITAFYDLFESIIDVTIFGANKIFGSGLEIYGVPVTSVLLLGAVGAIILSKGDEE